MASKKRYNTMVFPQGFDGNKLLLHIVLLPTNQDPFKTFATGLPAPAPATAISFADLQPQFALKIVKGLSEWPIGNADAASGKQPQAVTINVDAATNKKALLEAIAADFGARINSTDTDKAPELNDTKKLAVHKYLPETYRNAFNFTSPRTPNAKTDDSYHCAIRDDVKLVTPWKNDEDISWGQVYAHILRQPVLARACGMIYSAEVTVTGDLAALFAKGCYLYADITNEDYSKIQDGLCTDPDGPFIKPYAARIPKLLPGAANKRPVFAPILFPVLFSTGGGVDPEPPKAPWDKIFAELNEYSDGFAKIVHAQQPVSTDLLKEAPDGSHPVKDEGIRLAWDDEQILIWYMRQLEEYKENPADPAPGVRVDAPLGVYGYRLDVKEDEDAAAWSSLNLVNCNEAYSIGGIPLNNTVGQKIELPFQVFPSQLHNDTSSPFWLPMYFTGWTGKSLVLKDTDAISIHQIDQNEEKHEGVAKKVAADNRFDEVPANVGLRYGSRYRFRVRMMDISGGGPAMDADIPNETPSATAKWSFKRYIAPGLCRIEKPESLAVTDTEFFNEVINADKTHSFTDKPIIKIQRPTLNYPAVVFTNKYQAQGKDPVQLLIQSVQQQKAKGTTLPKGQVQIHPAIADPDVTQVHIKVEVETLRLDNLASDSGKENYITLYSTKRGFDNNDFEAELPLQIEFHDIAVLNLGSNDDPFNDPALTKAAIDAMDNLPLPTGRRIRVTVRGVCGDQDPSNESYYGFINEKDPDMDSRYGKTSQFHFYNESKEDVAPLLVPKANVPAVQALYLQPDPEYIRKGKTIPFFFFSAETSQQPDIMQRLAQQLGLRVKDNGLTLVAEKGERVIFGCSNKIRHHLAPDGSSITFSTKADLCHHWLGCLTYSLNRDWSWDALQDVAFTIGRNKKFKKDSEAEREKRDNIGDIELKHSASFESLIPDPFGRINRQGTTLIFFDAIEPKSERKQEGSEQPRFPDELEVTYTITPHFKPDHGTEMQFKQEVLELPCTVNPAQVPKIASVGIAFSKYEKGAKYNYTEPRQKYLWVELEEPVADPHDTLFCRVLHYAPDQLIGNNQQIAEINQATEEPPALPIDPEYIRIITPGQTDDMAGLSAMQSMEKAADTDDLHYLLPLPPGLHPESAELFGFFTYEFRIGHGHWSIDIGNKENLWSTAQGRFGRALSVAGMQHPAPTLLCSVDRDDLRVVVNAPYAKAVWQGRNVTCDPPRTQLHGVLYAQVKQADGEEYRNILLDTRLMNLVKPSRIIKEKAKSSDFADAIVSTALRTTDVWTVDKTDMVARAQVILSNLSLVNEVSKLKVDAVHQKKLNKAMVDYKKGKTVKMDMAMAGSVVAAFENLKTKYQDKVSIAPAVKFTEASVLSGAILAGYKDMQKTASIGWDNKEIAVLLQELGLPEDAALSVLVVEVFGNITSLLEHITYVSDDVLEKVGKTNDNAKKMADMLLDRRRKNRQALTSQLGNYRILRTSPLTEVPFVCCPTC